MEKVLETMILITVFKIFPTFFVAAGPVFLNPNQKYK